MSHLTEEQNNNFMLGYKVLQHSQTQQDLTSTTVWTDLLGSEISYTPSEGADFVIYEYVFHRSKKNSNTVNIKCKLLYSDDDGSTWNDYGNNTNTMFGSTLTNVRARSLTTLRLCLTSWGTSERKLKVQGLVHNGDIRLHKVWQFYDSSGATTSDRYVKPYVLCYSVRN